MTIGLIHSTRLAIPWVEQASTPLHGRMGFLHALDESLIVELKKNRGVTEGARRRIDCMARSLLDAGAERLVLTCSSLSPAVDILAPDLPVPFFKIDEPMIRAAVRSDLPFVILATNPSTAEPMRIIVEAEGKKAGVIAQWRYVLLDRAFEALNRGNAAAHDKELVAACLGMDLSSQCGHILFAQISMSRVLPQIPEPVRNRIATCLDYFPEIVQSQR